MYCRSYYMYFFTAMLVRLWKGPTNRLTKHCVFILVCLGLTVCTPVYYSMLLFIANIMHNSLCYYSVMSSVQVQNYYRTFFFPNFIPLVWLLLFVVCQKVKTEDF